MRSVRRSGLRKRGFGWRRDSQKSGGSRAGSAANRLRMFGFLGGLVRRNRFVGRMSLGFERPAGPGLLLRSERNRPTLLGLLQRVCWNLIRRWGWFEIGWVGGRKVGGRRWEGQIFAV